METFANTPEFGTFVSRIRMEFTAHSRQAVEARGGPSERHQQDIEAGKEMSITGRICTQYANYLEETEPGTGEFFAAACAAFAGAQKTPEREWDAEPLVPGAGFVIGEFVVKPGTVIRASSLTMSTRDIPHRISCAIRSWSTDKAFAKVASHIAARNTGITVVPLPVAVSYGLTNGPWPSHMTYRVGVASKNGFPRLFIDPLQGVRDLETAYERAAALGAADSDRTCLAWAVLLANGAAAQTGGRPLQSWMNVFAPPTGGIPGPSPSDERIRWGRLIAQLHADTGVTTTVSVDEVIATAQRYLLPWSEDWLGAKGLHFDAAEESGGTQLTWGLNTASDRSVEWTPDDSEDPIAPQLWLCERAAMKAVPAVLSDQRVANLLFDGDSLTAAGSLQPQFVWCSVGAGDRHAVLWELGARRWHSAVLY